MRFHERDLVEQLRQPIAIQCSRTRIGRHHRCEGTHEVWIGASKCLDDPFEISRTLGRSRGKAAHGGVRLLNLAEPVREAPAHDEIRDAASPGVDGVADRLKRRRGVAGPFLGCGNQPPCGRREPRDSGHRTGQLDGRAGLSTEQTLSLRQPGPGDEPGPTPRADAR
ncbi:hypothetical protein [Jiangella sp. DSM 45060]|uniref:hypothetical protein n=1 Tax=Jiangella sp. DSM 45060 TaxID=1798224 RepID=UPI00156179C9|nr:hypothetical protein [Jiangella sp. DSM 45060]